MNESLAILRELVALQSLRQAIDQAEADGMVNFVNDVPIPFAKDEIARREPLAWEAARQLVNAA